MPKDGLKSVAIPKHLYDILIARKRPHQAIAGVIEELINNADKQSNIKHDSLKMECDK